MKSPLRSRTGLLGREIVEILLITIASLEKRLQVVLLDLLTNDLLQRLALQDLIGLLLGSQFDQERLVDPLKCGHFRVLCRIGRMGCDFELANVSFTLCCIGADCPYRLQIANIYGIRDIDRRTLGSYRLLPLGTERGKAGDLARELKA